MTPARPDSPGPLDLACGETACSHRDPDRGRCRLVPPIAGAETVWIFALEGCPITRAYAGLVAAAEERAGVSWLDGRSPVAAADQRRLHAQQVHRRDLGEPRLLDVLAARLRDAPADPVLDPAGFPEEVARAADLMVGGSRR